ncbi:MAG: 2-C-methyl-D-erythritol 4-phosphate cytidylyltransferase [Limisphaerales bacterium]|jgi:2-C-methyl-D-erythritol 4-phosphate cytidylyltransferase|nr:2-C-methyl-D-erythritol 4-phosphate cytidylyltransferase [Verrucomicrobiota bacterium]
MKAAAIIVGAGRGVRMGGEIDKIFLEVDGAPLIVHTWRRFQSLPFISKIVLVVRPGVEKEFYSLATEYGLEQKPFSLVAGGAERQDSVWNGLLAVKEEGYDLVAIQDAARPCTPLAAIEKAFQTAAQYGAAVLAQRVTDTIKESCDGQMVDRTLDRSLLWAVQTPQVFQTKVIYKAIAAAIQRGEKLTDDTAACEMIGQKVYLVESTRPNPKATNPDDLPYIEMLLRKERMQSLK